MIFNPYFWVALVAICGICYVAGCTHQKAETDQVKAEWEADKKQRLADTERVEKERTDATAKFQQQTAVAETARNAQFADLQARVAARDSALGACNNDRNLLDSLLDTVRTTNAAVTGAPSDTKENSSTPATSTGIDDWFSKVGKLYADCRQEVIDWNSWYDGIKESR